MYSSIRPFPIIINSTLSLPSQLYFCKIKAHEQDKLRFFPRMSDAQLMSATYAYSIYMFNIEHISYAYAALGFIHALPNDEYEDSFV